MPYTTAHYFSFPAPVGCYEFDRFLTLARYETTDSDTVYERKILDI